MEREQVLTIFTVDDSEIIYKNMSTWLTPNKHVKWLGHAFSVPDAYKQISTQNPQLVILDIQLKADSSFELLQYIHKQHPHTEVIMFTNHSTEPYRKKCKEFGAKYFLDKSTEFEKIPQILNELLQSN
ncbi:MAG TPA: response regulator [Bacteroidia bacterium]|nr:response regulator [Bacteroidia bacterium]